MRSPYFFLLHHFRHHCCVLWIQYIPFQRQSEVTELQGLRQNILIISQGSYWFGWNMLSQTTIISNILFNLFLFFIFNIKKIWNLIFFHTLLTYLPYFFVRTTFVKTKIFLLMSLEFEWFYNCAVGIMNKSLSCYCRIESGRHNF